MPAAIPVPMTDRGERRHGSPHEMASMPQVPFVGTESHGVGKTPAAWTPGRKSRVWKRQVIDEEQPL